MIYMQGIKNKLISLWPVIKYPLIIAGIFIAGYVLWDVISNWILEILGFGTLGAGAVYASKQRAKEHKTIADEHESMMDAGLDKAQREQIEADKERAKTNKIAGEMQPMPDEPAPGKERKNFTAR